jgi:hypothetical protein
VVQLLHPAVEGGSGTVRGPNVLLNDANQLRVLETDVEQLSSQILEAIDLVLSEVQRILSVIRKILVAGTVLDTLMVDKAQVTGVDGTGDVLVHSKQNGRSNGLNICLFHMRSFLS